MGGEDIEGSQSLSALLRETGPDQLSAYMIGIARAEASSLRDTSGGQNLTREVHREGLSLADISPSDDDEPEEIRRDDGKSTGVSPSVIAAAIENALEKFFTPLRKKMLSQTLLTLTDEPPHVREVHLLFDSRYANIDGGKMSFLLSSVSRAHGHAYSLKEPENVFEIRVSELSLPTDVPWGGEAEQTNRSEITLLFEEAAGWAYHDRDNAHHFRGYADSTEAARYLYYLGSTSTVIADAITSNQNAIVRWYDRGFKFDEPFSFRGRATLVWRRSGIEIPFYKCVYVVNVTFANGGAITVTMPSSATIANAEALLVGDVVFFESAVSDGGGTTLNADEGYEVTVAASSSKTFTIEGTGSADITVENVVMVVPKWRMRADVTMRCLTAAPTNFTHP